MVLAGDTEFPNSPSRRRRTLMTVSGFPCWGLLLQFSLMLFLVWQCAALPLNGLNPTVQQLRRKVLQAGENGEGPTPPPCEAPENATGSENNCPPPELKGVQKESSTENEEGSDPDRNNAVIPASTVAGVVGFVGSVTLLIGYIYYRKDPERFREKYGRIISLIPSRHTQQAHMAQSLPPSGPPRPAVRQPQSAQTVVAPVSPSSQPAPVHPLVAPLPQQQPRNNGQIDDDSQPQRLYVSSSAPTPWRNPDMPIGQQQATVVSGRFVLPETVPRAQPPRMVPPPALTVGSIGQGFANPSAQTHRTRHIQFGAGIAEACQWGQTGLHTFPHDGANSHSDADSSQHSLPGTGIGVPKGSVASGQQEPSSRPPRSPFFPLRSSPGSQSVSGIGTPPLQQMEQVTVSSNGDSLPGQPHSRPEPATDQQREGCELDYDIRVLPLSDSPTVLGRGAFGTVEPGVFTDSSGNIVHVAVKYGTDLFDTMSPSEVLSIFQSELDVLCRVPAHANIVHCYGGRVKFDDERDIGSRDVYIVEELMHANLQDVIHGDDFSGGLPYKLILKIALHIATGLEHLHQAGVLHYDLKPANILVDEVFNAKIADFGSSKMKATSYITGTFRGTLGYMAPELWVRAFIRNIQINEKIDVYSFGVVLWEMVEQVHPANPLSAGEQNSTGPTTELVPPIEEDRFPLSRRCPEGLRQLIQDCTNLTPQLRPGARQARERVEVMISQNQNRSNLSTGVDG